MFIFFLHAQILEPESALLVYPKKYVKTDISGEEGRREGMSERRTDGNDTRKLFPVRML